MLRRRAKGVNTDFALVPGGPFVCWLVGGTGFVVTVLALFLAMVPPTHSASPALFTAKVVGGCALLIAIGLAFYVRGRRSVLAERISPYRG